MDGGQPRSTPTCSVHLLRLLMTPQLRALLAAGERRSCSAGAKALHLSESALKHRIGQLEDALGTRLTVPGHRPLRLTPAGGRLMLFAASLRDQCARLEGSLASHASEVATEPPAERSPLAADATIAMLEQACQLLGDAIEHVYAER